MSLLAATVALQLLPELKDPNRHFQLLPLIEELEPLLLRGRDGEVVGSVVGSVGEGLRVKWALLLGALAQALLSNLAIARSESTAIVQVRVCVCVCMCSEKEGAGAGGGRRAP